MSETGDAFAGASERSTKHSPRVDEELEHEMQGMLKVRSAPPGPRSGARSSRRPRASRTSTPTRAAPWSAARRWAWTPTRSSRARRLARWLDRADFPSSGAELGRGGPGPPAPDAVVAELGRLPEGDTFERVGDVVRALGYPTET